MSYVERDPVQHVRREGVDKSSSASFLGRGTVRDPREAGLMMHPCGWPTRASAQALKRAIASLSVIVLLDTRQAPRRPCPPADA